MRIGRPVAMLIICAGCAAAPEPAGDLVRACVADRAAVIRNEWARFESMSRQRVFFPDWRGKSRQWAGMECTRGRRIADFHPVDVATARRHY